MDFFSLAKNKIWWSLYLPALQQIVLIVILFILLLRLTIKLKKIINIKSVYNNLKGLAWLLTRQLL